MDRATNTRGIRGGIRSGRTSKQAGAPTSNSHHQIAKKHTRASSTSNRRNQIKTPKIQIQIEWELLSSTKKGHEELRRLQEWSSYHLFRSQNGMEKKD